MEIFYPISKHVYVNGTVRPIKLKYMCGKPGPNWVRVTDLFFVYFLFNNI